MLPYRRVKRTYELVCSQRGYYILGTSTLTTGDILGFAEKVRTFDFDTALHVYPVPLPWRKLSLPTRSWQGDMVVRRFILPDPFMPAGVRDYMPGDPLSYINWKASAKTGKLAVHRHDFTADTKLMVLFNVDADANQWTAPNEKQAAMMEMALRLLATILELAVSNGMQTALRTNSIGKRDMNEVTVPPAFGHAQRERLFAALAEMTLKRTRSFHMLLREAIGADEPVHAPAPAAVSQDSLAVKAARELLKPSHGGVKDTDILIMTRYLTNEIEEDITALRRAGNKGEVFLIPDFSAGTQEGGVAV